MGIKIPLYNALNMLLTGLVFLWGTFIIYPSDTAMLLNSTIIENIRTGPEIIITACAIGAAYEFGLIINRVGSVVIEPVLRRMKMIEYDDDYVLYNIKKEEFPIMSTLSREYALSRTGIALFLILFALSIFELNWRLAVANIAISIVYYLSCKKHAAKIVKLMHSQNSLKNIKV